MLPAFYSTNKRLCCIVDSQSGVPKPLFGKMQNKIQIKYFQNIQSLFKLKSFNKALEENVETSEEVSNEVNRRFEKIKNNGLKAKSDEDRVKVEEIKPVFSTKEDTDSFNEWYWQEVDNQNEKRKVNTKSKLQLSYQDEEDSCSHMAVQEPTQS